MRRPKLSNSRVGSARLKAISTGCVPEGCRWLLDPLGDPKYQPVSVLKCSVRVMMASARFDHLTSRCSIASLTQATRGLRKARGDSGRGIGACQARPLGAGGLSPDGSSQFATPTPTFVSWVAQKRNMLLLFISSLDAGRKEYLHTPGLILAERTQSAPTHRPDIPLPAGPGNGMHIIPPYPAQRRACGGRSDRNAQG
jgi:hypothetical protein